MCSLEQRRARGDMIAVLNYVKGNRVEEGFNLFTAALETRTRSNEFKLQERRFHLNSRKHFLIVRAVGRWNRPLIALTIMHMAKKVNRENFFLSPIIPELRGTQ